MNTNEKSWFELTFQEKLLEAHRAVLFPKEMDKNKRDFLVMVIELLVEKTTGMTDCEIDEMFTH